MVTGLVYRHRQRAVWHVVSCGQVAAAGQRGQVSLGDRLTVRQELYGVAIAGAGR